MYINTQTLEYPYSLSKMRRDNPSVSFPLNPPAETLAAYHVAPVQRTGAEAQDGHRLVEGEPTLVEGTWTQVWQQVPLTAGELAAQESARDAEAMAERYSQARLAAAMQVLADRVLASQVVADQLSEDELAASAILFDTWRVGVVYTAKKVLERNGFVYAVTLNHTSQSDWAPEVATTLFRRINQSAPGEIPTWQPWDGHNESLHQVGSEVMHNGLHWRSNAPNNHWEPGAFGWDQVV